MSRGIDAAWFAQWLKEGMDRSGLTPEPPVTPEPPPDGEFAVTRAAHLAPSALDATVGNAMPVPFAWTDPALRSQANGGSILSAASDVRMETSGGTALEWGRESYDAVAGTLRGWVRLPSGVGTAGYTFVVKFGLADATDQAQPTATASGYKFFSVTGGVDWAAGRNLTLQSGVAAGSLPGELTFDGNGGLAVNGDSSFLDGGLTEGWFVWVDGDASMADTARGFIVEGNLAALTESGRLWRNTPLTDGDNLRIGAHRTGGWSVWNGPSGSRIDGPMSICANYLDGEAIQVALNGTFTTPASISVSSGQLRIWGNDFAIGRGSTEAAGSESWLGSSGPVHCRPTAYSTAEAILLARIFFGDRSWQPVQLADADGNFAALPTRPLEPGDDPPSVTTSDATAIGETAATLNGSLTTLGTQAEATVNFEWRQTGAPSWTATAGQLRSTPGTFNAALSGLTTETNHEFRAKVAWGSSTAVGSTLGFLTSGTPPPTGGEGTTLPTPLDTINVSNQTQFNNAMAAADPGDRIVLANGSYTMPTLNRAGTTSNPIQIVAANILGAVITSFYNVAAQNLIFYGLDHANGVGCSAGNGAAAHGIKMYRCRWKNQSGPTQGIMVRFYNVNPGDVAYCEWDSIPGRSFVFNVENGCRNTVVRRCYFHDQPDFPDNATEAIQLGFAGGSGSEDTASFCTIEYNLFENMRNDPEAISIKAGSNIIRQNTFRNTNWLTNRVGTNNLYEANTMINSHGIENFDGTPGTGATTTWGNRWLGNSVTSPTNSNRLFAGNQAAGSGLFSSAYRASRATVLAGNEFANTTLIGYMYSSVTVTHPAESTRIRQHSGTISLVGGNTANTSNLPGTSETLFTWAARTPLVAADVGPFADL